MMVKRSSPILLLNQWGLSRIFKKQETDITVILGDRFEALGFALACYSLGIPIAHIHGGEITAGALDDGFVIV